MNSKCYRKFFFRGRISWYDASNYCLSRGGSLAVFTDIGRPSDSSQLTDWLNTSGIDKTYWIGLIRSWWKTTSEGGFELLCWWCTVDMVCSDRILARKCITYLPFPPDFSCCRESSPLSTKLPQTRWYDITVNEFSRVPKKIMVILRCRLCHQKVLNLANRTQPMTRTRGRLEVVSLAWNCSCKWAHSSEISTCVCCMAEHWTRSVSVWRRRVTTQWTFGDEIPPSLALLALRRPSVFGLSARASVRGHILKCVNMISYKPIVGILLTKCTT